MEQEIEKIIEDLSKNLKIDIKNSQIHFFGDGATDSVVFSIDNKYLIKTVDINTLNIQVEFLQFYKDIPNMKKVLFYNDKLKYICFKYIDGERFGEKSKQNSNNIVEKIFGIVSQYKPYQYEEYGYLWEDHKTWNEFLESEVLYSMEAIEKLKIPKDKVNSALENIKDFDVPQYLIHGDFGTHNFLIKDKEIMIIDPMPVIGDYLYDFYYAVFSNINIFHELELDYILSFFERDEQYKKDLLIIVLYIRMCRCYIYNRQDFEIYLKLYNAI